MRSRRSRLELACRLGAFALIGWLLGIALVPSTGRRVERATASGLARQLPRWTHAPPRVAMHAELESAPEPWATAWLAALRRTGRPVTWSGSPPAAAVVVEPIVDPFGGARIAIAAPPRATVVVRDEASVLDSLRVPNVGASITVPLLVGAVSVTTYGQTLTAAEVDSIAVRPIVVMGRAGWEGKFVVAALEERGWSVVARLSVAPGVDVTQGPLVLDTARVSAVVALDSSVAALGASIERFVRDGGGLVLAGAASLAPNVASVAPGTLGARRPPLLPVPDTLGRASAGFYPVSLRRDAVAIERRGDAVAVGARRVGAGRVIAVGFDESWRWRMAGAPGADAAHREWWSRVVTSVAHGPVHVRPSLAARISGSAPLARLVDQMGRPRTTAGPPAELWSPDPRVLLALLLTLLLVEWASRRLRGAR